MRNADRNIEEKPFQNSRNNEMSEYVQRFHSRDGLNSPLISVVYNKKEFPHTSMMDVGC